MSSKTIDLDKIAKRLNENYPQCRITETDGRLVIELPISKIEVNGFHVAVSVLDEAFDEVDCENTDELYEVIEEFILVLREDEKYCNPTFARANKNAAKYFRMLLYAAAALLTVMIIVCSVFDLSLVYLLIGVIVPWFAVIPMRFICGNSFKRDWVCPHCGASLPMEEKKIIPCAKFAASCPECGKSLLEKSLVEQLKKDIFSEENEDVEEASDYKPEIPKRGGKKVCTVFGIVLLIFTLVFSVLMFGYVDSKEPAVTVLNAITLLAAGAMGAALIFCHEPEFERVSSPQIVVCERKWIQGLGIAVLIPGLLLLFASFVVSTVAPVSIGQVILFSLAGLFLLGLGAWMCLARRNRVVYICSSAVIYVSSFGRKREIECAQISDVKLDSSGSIKFRNKTGKTLFSIENNMIGADSAIDWIDRQKFSVNATKRFEKQVEQMENENVVSWHEEYRTPLHEHLKAIRAGLVIVMLLFAAGSIAPLVLYLHDKLKIAQAIYLTSFSPLPLLLYYLAFAPVLASDFPACATEEWKSMHIKFPVISFAFISLFSGAKIFYFWEKNILQVADSGRFMLFMGVIAAVLIALFYIRTPKRLRKLDAFVMIILSLFMLALVITYGVNLAISGPAEHYTAVVVERTEPSTDDENADRTLTVLLNDGTETTLNVTESVYNLEKSGVEFVVCQKENFLGIRTVRLHLPEGTDVSRLLNPNQNGETQ